MAFSDTILSGTPSFMHPDDEEELRKIVAERERATQAAVPVAPAPPKNAWTDPVFLQAMVPVFTELQSLKGELAGYKSDETAAAAPAIGQVDLGMAVPGAIAGTASDALIPGGFSGGTRLAMNGPAARPSVPPAATQPQYASGIAPPDIAFGPQTVQGDGSADAAPNPPPAAPASVARPDWSVEKAVPVPVPKRNPLRAPASGAVEAATSATAPPPPNVAPAGQPAGATAPDSSKSLAAAPPPDWRALLKQFAQSSKVHVADLDQDFAERFRDMILAAPKEIREKLVITSAYRPDEEQLAIFQRKMTALARWKGLLPDDATFEKGRFKPDDWKWLVSEARKSVDSLAFARKYQLAPEIGLPMSMDGEAGHKAVGSQHLYRRAVDIGGKSDKDDTVRNWFLQNAERFGFHFPIRRTEKWHMELKSDRPDGMTIVRPPPTLGR